MDMIETKALEFAYPAEEGEKPVLALRGVTRPLKRAALWWCWGITAPANPPLPKA